VTALATENALALELEPTEAGFDPDRLARLDAYLDACVASDLHKGSLIALARGGKLFHVSCRGHRDADRDLPVEPDTIWRIYSMTKPITSVAALLLFEDGLLSLSDPVERFIPAFANPRVYEAGPAQAMLSVPAPEPIRIWHLLTHTAGMTYTSIATHPVAEAYRAAGLGLPTEPADYTLAEACERLATMPLLFEPGSEWNYSFATDVLGRVIEVASGTTLDRFMADRIFGPLGMRETGFTPPPTDRFAAPYTVDPETGTAVRATDQAITAGEAPRFLSGGAGLVSTAADYLRFAQMLLRRGELDGVRLLAPRTVDLMTANHLPGDTTLTTFGRPPGVPVASLAGRGFGLGVAPLIDPVGVKSLSSRGEYGWGGAAGTDFWVDPEEDLTVVFMMQALPPPDAVWLNLRRLVYQALVDDVA
jgi:CubicO group peptidase (beta-lactamase class C family)